MGRGASLLRQARALHKEHAIYIDNKHKKDLIFYDDYSIDFVNTKIFYKPFSTLAAFHASRDDFKIIIGAFGSGKSTGCIAEILLRAHRMPFCNDGIRRYKCVIVRETYKQLLKTSFELWENWCSKIGNVTSHKSPPLHYKHIVKDELGVIEIIIDFLAIDRIDRISDLQSLQTTDVFVNEMPNTDKFIVDTLASRCGRYPMAVWLKPEDRNYLHGIFGDGNPPDEYHYIAQLEKTGKELTGNNAIEYHVFKNVYEYELNGVKKKNSATIFHQPPQILQRLNGEWYGNEHAENIENLAAGYEYYFKMLSRGKSFVKVFAQGFYGEVQSEQVVFQNFNSVIHVSADIGLAPAYPVIFGIDYGRICPGILIAQYVEGQIRFIKEWYGTITSIKELFQVQVIPFITKYLPQIDIEALIGDPAKTDNGQRQMEELGYQVDDAPTNNVEMRIDSVTNALNELVNGQPRILISQLGCPKTISAFTSKYRYRKIKWNSEEYIKDKPEKNHPFSEFMDCVQYIVCYYTFNERKEWEDNNEMDHDQIYRDQYRSAITGY